MMPTNMLYIFKNENPPASFAQHENIGEDRIFFHTLCTGGGKSYRVEHLNSLFENGENIDHLFERVVSMMQYLQEGYHSGEYYGPPGEYHAASTEYPLKYELLVDNLSEVALDVIKGINSGSAIEADEEGIGTDFCKTLIEDRTSILTSPDLDDGLSYTPV